VNFSMEGEYGGELLLAIVSKLVTIIILVI
jgi:hypothetical protein